ncbi:MAG: DUF4185 domain-containing protein [Mycobacterium sp.]
MRAKIGAAAHVGRIGALAVALGVGAAIAAGQGTAWADTTDSGSSGSTSSASSAPSANQGPAAKTAAKGKSGSSATTKATAPSAAKSSPAKSAATKSAASKPVSSKPSAAKAPATSTDTTAAVTTATIKAPVTATAQKPVSGLVSGLLSAVGFTPAAGNTPVTPKAPPADLALLAAARKEFEPDATSVVQTAAASSVVSTAAVTTAAATAVPSSLPSTPVGWVTGVTNPPPGPFAPSIPQTNNTSGFNIYGTDLGIMWDNQQTGDTHYVLTAFGDTFSGPNMTGDWRSNVLVLSQDTNLYNGMSLLQTGPTYQFIPSAPSALGLFGSEVTIIPTSGIAVQGNQYVNYMSVKSWDTPGRWTTNYSATSVYNPATDKWVLAPSTIRSASWFGSSTLYVPGSQNFQQAAYVLQPEDQVGADGVRYLYAFGTPSGRGGSAYLSRVAQDSVTDLTKYQYWNGNSWVTGNPAVATPVIGTANDTRPIIGFFVDLANDPNFFGGVFGGLLGAKQGGNVSEMSVQYNEYLDKYVVMYGDGNNNVQMRYADTPEGPWSDPITVATSAQYPGLYAPMIHPWSGTGLLTDSAGDPDVNNLYWNMSIWGDYNVVMMQTDLSPLKTVQV